jgi:hypothetical protein
MMRLADCVWVCAVNFMWGGAVGGQTTRQPLGEGLMDNRLFVNTDTKLKSIPANKACHGRLAVLLARERQPGNIAHLLHTLN